MKTLKNTVIPQPFEKFTPSNFRTFDAIIETADNSFVFTPAIPALADRLIKKVFDDLI
jgi:hypothetical protein